MKEQIKEIIKEVIKTDQEEKMQYFASAISDRSLMTDMEGDKKKLFVELISKYTLTHIKFLLAMSKQKDYQYSQKVGGTIHTQCNVRESIFNVMCDNDSSLKSEFEYATLYIQILSSDGLVNTADINKQGSPEWTRANHLTKVGADFLAFICERGE